MDLIQKHNLISQWASTGGSYFELNNGYNGEIQSVLRLVLKEGERLQKSQGLYLSHLESTKDYDYLITHLAAKSLQTLEDILAAYESEKISINIVRDADGHIDFDKSFGLLIHDASYQETGLESIAIKWYESFEDTDFLADCFADCISLSNQLNSAREKFDLRSRNGSTLSNTLCSRGFI